ncbi:hypothetical protein F5X99DRAFT_414240 [Biscogniauxia marginata]|nr:hypothetical protein F5X99DRAFT_414240 [Biscogniauxia marginata]
MSVTDNRDKVRSIRSKYISRGFTGIEIIRFNSSGPGWDHAVQRLWRVTDLCRSLGMRRLSTLPFLTFDYLLEDSIPEESMVDCELLDQPEAEKDLEPGQKRKRGSDEEVEATKGGTETSDKHHDLADMVQVVDGTSQGHKNVTLGPKNTEAPRNLDTLATLAGESTGANNVRDTGDDSGLDSDSDGDQVVVKKRRWRKRATEFKLRI